MQAGVLIDYFEPERYIKDSNDVELCETIMKENFSFLQIFFQKWITHSKNYPEMDQPMSKLMVEELVKEYNKNTNEYLNINDAKF